MVSISREAIDCILETVQHGLDAATAGGAGTGVSDSEGMLLQLLFDLRFAAYVLRGAQEVPTTIHTQTHARAHTHTTHARARARASSRDCREPPPTNPRRLRLKCCVHGTRGRLLCVVCGPCRRSTHGG